MDERGIKATTGSVAMLLLVVVVVVAVLVIIRRVLRSERMGECSGAAADVLQFPQRVGDSFYGRVKTEIRAASASCAARRIYESWFESIRGEF